jgi:hypothetical protein
MRSNAVTNVLLESPPAKAFFHAELLLKANAGESVGRFFHHVIISICPFKLRLDSMVLRDLFAIADAVQREASGAGLLDLHLASSAELAAVNHSRSTT